MNTIEQIKNNDVYKQVLADSFGGIMYNVANQGKYNTTELLQLWNNVTPAVQDSADGIMKGAIDFVQGAI